MAQLGICHQNFLDLQGLTCIDSLNLTAASYVHIVEPQWNPMVEAQAAGRVDRLDQTKNIVIIRYIVERSIEEVRFHIRG